jgi:alpha-1,6-mannosyltransferase
MSGDASTFPLRATATGRGGAPGGWLRRARGGELEGARARSELVGGLALAGIVALSLFVVLVAANRPSLLTPTTHAGYFPRWMAGPLGGLLPWITDNGTTLRYLFTGAIVAMYGGYLLALRHASRLPKRWIVAAILAAHAIFLLSPPLALTDVFNYINYGRMEVVHSLNPYTTIPILEPHDDPSFLLSNWHQLLSPYGPLFTLLTFAVVPLGVAASFWTLKAILVASSLATILLVWRGARLLGRDPLVAVTLVGLNPVVLVWGLGGDHNDFPMMFFIVLGFYLLLLTRTRSAGAHGEDRAAGAPGAAERSARASLEREESWAGGLTRERLRGWLVPLSAIELGAGAAFVTATAIKASGGVLIPVVLAGLLRAPRALVQVVAGMVAAGAVLGAASLLAFGLHVPDLSTQGSLVTSESVPNLLGLAVGAGGESSGLRQALSGVLVALVLVCCWLAWRQRPDAGPQAASATAGAPSCARVERTITASGWASVALLVTLSWVLPWYVLWVAPLAALSRSRRLRTASLVLGVYLIVAWAPASGLLWKAIGFNPTKTSLGRLHQRYVKELLD